MTERSGHARELAIAALNRGVTSIVAWGGDGTVNEVASVLAFREATLAIIPSGSGNGLATELLIPRDPDGAFEAAFCGRDCRIDAGELDSRLSSTSPASVSTPGSHTASPPWPGAPRLPSLLEIAAQELFPQVRSPHHRHRRRLDPVDAMIIAIANARQYGNGALIAPAARLNDGAGRRRHRRASVRGIVHAPRCLQDRSPGFAASLTCVRRTSK